MPSGPYLPTSATYLKQSSLLLQAYPDTTRITTKYTFPSKPPSSSTTKSSTPQQPQPPSTTTAPPIATLTLKTYTPEAGICLKYRTNKAAEVGRLFTALGLLAGGTDITSLDSGVASAVVEGADEEGTGTGIGAGAPSAAATAGVSAGGTQGAGGKGKGGKKKGKGGKK
ncbi:signal recognition particle 9 kDa protein-domain-containing protein [Aspergillus cavernicola]|uniref:Signal recognition particle 9 kDa protein-domain-containing protein n=1 Tax=Aspergillus cavernicola TaxID=176166 RepID=A0ABR4IQY5_9EURO